MDIAQYHYYKPNKIILRITGMWPYQNSWSARLRRLFVLVILWTASFTEFKKVSRVYNDFNILIEIIPEALIVTSCGIAFFLLFPSTNNFSKTLDLILYDWKMEHTIEEIKIKESYAKTAKLLTLIMIAYGLIVFIPIMVIDKTLMLFNNKTREYLFPVEHIDDHSYSYLYVINMYLTSIIAPYFILINSLMFAIQVYHFYGMLHIIGHRLRRLNNKEADLLKHKVAVTHDLAHRTIISCIKTHVLAIELANEMESYYGPCLFVIVVAVIIIISMTLLLMDFHNVHAKSFIFASGQLIFFAGLCYGGQRAINATQHISDEAYDVEWYAYPLRTQKLLYLIIQRSNTPFIFTSATAFSLSYKNFGEVIKTAISYYMVLRNFR